VIVSIDPGLRATGIAVWDHHQGRYYLRRAHLVKNNAKDLAMSVVNVSRGVAIGGHVLEAVIIEFPKILTRDKSVADPADLLAVAAVAGGAMAHLALHAHEKTKLEFVLPAQWKGAAPKKTASGHNPIKNRCLADLHLRELDNVVLPGKTLEHNIYDAIALGLWFLRREKLRSASPDRSMQNLTDKHVN
jgi:hypothetical protein